MTTTKDTQQLSDKDKKKSSDSGTKPAAKRAKKPGRKTTTKKQKPKTQTEILNETLQRLSTQLESRDKQILAQDKKLAGLEVALKSAASLNTKLNEKIDELNNTTLDKAAEIADKVGEIMVESLATKFQESSDNLVTNLLPKVVKGFGDKAAELSRIVSAQNSLYKKREEEYEQRDNESYRKHEELINNVAHRSSAIEAASLSIIDKLESISSAVNDATEDVSEKIEKAAPEFIKLIKDGQVEHAKELVDESSNHIEEIRKSAIESIESADNSAGEILKNVLEVINTSSDLISQIATDRHGLTDILEEMKDIREDIDSKYGDITSLGRELIELNDIDSDD